MQREHFWNIVQAARDNAAHPEERVETLRLQLYALSQEELEGFQQNYDAVLHDANSWDLWGAAYLMNGGCSDDGFRYFCHWLISEGRERFERSLQTPDTLAEVPRRDYFELELFAYVAAQLYEAKFGNELERDFSIELATPKGSEWSEDELPSKFPRLAQKYAA